MKAGDVDEILGMMTPEATVSLVPLNRHGPMAADGASYLRELSRSFPDLLVRVPRLFVAGDNTAVARGIGPRYANARVRRPRLPCFATC